MKTIQIYKILLMFFLSTSLFVSGCGYRFREAGEPVGIDIGSIAIPMMSSTSSETGFEADFTGVIREEFINNSKIPIVSAAKADAVLTGRIYDISTQAITYDVTEQTISGQTVSYETTSSRRLIIMLDVKLVDKSSGKTIWYESAMKDEARYDVGTDPLSNRYNQQQALKEVAGLIAKKIYLKTLDRF
ncbi:LPS assembly lipoprotein LptE [Thermodesulfobacteriota bacterium]